MFSYDEDDMVEDPNLAQHLAHFGINITQMEKVHLYIECGICVTSVFNMNTGLHVVQNVSS